MRKLRYGIEPEPPDLISEGARHAVYTRIALIVLVGALFIVVAWAFVGEGPPPSDRPSDTFYGLSERP